MIEAPILFLIRIYQLTFSPDHGVMRARYTHGYCRHYPTCSQYAYEAVIMSGVARGLWYAGKRVARCHPWAQPRIDYPR